MSQHYHIIGDVHGNFRQLEELLLVLGYLRPDPESDPFDWRAPDGYQLVSVGDLVDRGPDSLACIRTLKRMVETGNAQLVPGNHELRYLQMLRSALGLTSFAPKLSIGQMSSLVQILGLSGDEQRELLTFIESLPPFLELDEGRLIIAHARWENGFRRLDGPAALMACACGKTERVGHSPNPRGEATPPIQTEGPLVSTSPHNSLPDRAVWVRDWKGPATVVWGHQVIVPGCVTRIGHTINVESGAYVGEKLSAYIYPEDKVVQVPGTGVSSRRILQRYRDVAYLVFPRTLDEVRETISEQELADVDEYLLFLELELERMGGPAMYDLLEEAHRRIWDRCLSPDAPTEPLEPSEVSEIERRLHDAT